MFILVANLMKTWWSPDRSLSKHEDNCCDCDCLCRRQWTRHEARARPLHPNNTMCYVGKYHILEWGGNSFLSVSEMRYEDDISPQSCSPSKYHDGEERKMNWLSVLCWNAEDKFSTQRCALSYLINFQRSNATNLMMLTIKRRRRKRMTLTKINIFYFRKTFDKAQLWFSYTI